MNDLIVLAALLPERPLFYRLVGHEPQAVPSILETEVGTPVRKSGNGIAQVSTVFLGIDHNHWGEGLPLLFETMIFGGKHDQEQFRCSTWDEAVDMHEAACELAFDSP